LLGNICNSHFSRKTGGYESKAEQRCEKYFSFCLHPALGEIKAQQVPTIGLYLRHNALKSYNLKKRRSNLKSFLVDKSLKIIRWL